MKYPLRKEHNTTDQSHNINRPHQTHRSIKVSLSPQQNLTYNLQIPTSPFFFMPPPKTPLPTPVLPPRPKPSSRSQKTSHLRKTAPPLPEFYATALRSHELYRTELGSQEAHDSRHDARLSLFHGNNEALAQAAWWDLRLHKQTLSHRTVVPFSKLNSSSGSPNSRLNTSNPQPSEIRVNNTNRRPRNNNNDTNPPRPNTNQSNKQLFRTRYKVAPLAKLNSE